MVLNEKWLKWNYFISGLMKCGYKFALFSCWSQIISVTLRLDMFIINLNLNTFSCAEIKLFAETRTEKNQDWKKLRTFDKLQWEPENCGIDIVLFLFCYFKNNLDLNSLHLQCIWLFFYSLNLFFYFIFRRSNKSTESTEFNFNFLIHLSLQPDGACLCYFKLWLFYSFKK